MHRPPVIIDEIRCAPDLLAYVKESIDEQRDGPGRLLVAGSRILAVSQQVSELLVGGAGREIVKCGMVVLS